jgi:site-specific DNA-cytosine methylase
MVYYSETEEEELRRQGVLPSDLTGTQPILGEYQSLFDDLAAGNLVIKSGASSAQAAVAAPTQEPETPGTPVYLPNLDFLQTGGEIEFSTMDYLSNMGQSFLRSAADVPLSAIQGMAMADDYGKDSQVDDVMRAAKEWVRETLPGEPGLANSISGDVSGAFGSAGAFFGLGQLGMTAGAAVGGATAGPAGVIAGGLAGSVGTTAVVGSFSMGAQMYDEALAMGATPEQAEDAYKAGLFIGSLEGIPMGIGSAAKRLATASMKMGGEALRRMTAREIAELAAWEGFEEAIQEGGSAQLQQVAEKTIGYRKEYDFGEVLYQGALGAGPGATISAYASNKENQQIDAELGDRRLKAEEEAEAAALAAARDAEAGARVRAFDEKVKGVAELLAQNEAELQSLEAAAAAETTATETVDTAKPAIPGEVELPADAKPPVLEEIAGETASAEAVVPTTETAAPEAEAAPVESTATEPTTTTVPVVATPEIVAKRAEVERLRKQQELLLEQAKSIEATEGVREKERMAGPYGEARAAATLAGELEAFDAAVAAGQTRVLDATAQRDLDDHVRKLTKAKNMDDLATINPKDVRAVLPRNVEQQNAERRLNDLGYEVTFVDYGKDVNLEGAYDGTTNRIYLNARLSNEAILKRVARHETFHGLFKNNKAEWESIMATIKAAKGELWNAARRRFIASRTAAIKDDPAALAKWIKNNANAITDETGSLISDWFSATMDALEADPKLVSELAQADAGFLKRLVDWVRVQLRRVGFDYTSISDKERAALARLPALADKAMQESLSVNERLFIAQTLMRGLTAIESAAKMQMSGQERQAQAFLGRTLGEIKTRKEAEAQRAAAAEAARVKLETDQKSRAEKEAAQKEKARVKVVDTARTRIARIKKDSADWPLVEAVANAKSAIELDAAIAPLVPAEATEVERKELTDAIWAVAYKQLEKEVAKETADKKRKEEEAQKKADVATKEKQRAADALKARQEAAKTKAAKEAEKAEAKRKAQEEQYQRRFKQVKSDNPTGQAKALLNAVYKAGANEDAALEAAREFLGNEATDAQVLETALEAIRITQDRLGRERAAAAERERAAQEAQKKAAEVLAQKQRQEAEAKEAAAKAAAGRLAAQQQEAAAAKAAADRKAEEEQQEAAERQARRETELPTVSRGRTVPGQLEVGDLVIFGEKGVSKVVAATGSGTEQRVMIIPITRSEAARVAILERQGVRNWWTRIKWAGEPITVDMTDPRFKALVRRRSAEEMRRDETKRLMKERIKAQAERKKGDLPRFSYNNQITPEIDAAYLAAVESGNMDTAQQMVNKAMDIAGIVMPTVVQRQTNYAADVTVQNNRAYSPIVRDLLRRRAEGENITQAMLNEAIVNNFPSSLVKVPNTVADLPSEAEVINALDERQKVQRIEKQSIPINSQVTLRQDVPSWTRNKVGVVTIQTKNGKAYSQAARILNPDFVVNEKASLKIAMGESKKPHIAILGTWSSDQSMPSNLEKWTQVGYNPDRHSFYYDRATMIEVVGGSEAYQVGNTVFVKDAQYINDPVLYDAQGNIIPLSQRFQDTNDDIRFSYNQTTPEIDAAYLAAVESGDMDTAQRMVRKEAQANGYTIETSHGTAFKFNEFKADAGEKTDAGAYGKGFYFGSEKLAKIYSQSSAARYNKFGGINPVTKEEAKPRIVRVYLKLNNPYVPISKMLSQDAFRDEVAMLASNNEDRQMLLNAFFTTEKEASTITRILKENGYDGVSAPGEQVAFDSSQIKSADPVTYDDNGKLIPLSQRFQDTTNDVRFSYNDPRVATAFSGMGTVEAALGPITSALTAENDARKVEAYNNAFGTSYKAREVKELTVDELKQADCDLFHASPSCKEFSTAKADRAPTELEVRSAEKVAELIAGALPPAVSVENVPAYVDFPPFQKILTALKENGYKHRVLVVDAADYGAVQSRKRMILQAVREGELPPLPPKKSPRDWYEAIQDLLPTLEVDKEGVGPDEQMRIDKWIASGRLDPNKPIITMGGSAFAGAPAAANSGGLAPTLTANKGRVRIIIPDGTVLKASPRVLARLMSLPDTYKVPSQYTLAKEVLGNGIDGTITEAFIKPLLPEAAIDADGAYEAEYNEVPDDLRMSYTEGEAPRDVFGRFKSRTSKQKVESAAMQLLRERARRNKIRLAEIGKDENKEIRALAKKAELEGEGTKVGETPIGIAMPTAEPGTRAYLRAVREYQRENPDAMFEDIALDRQARVVANEQLELDYEGTYRNLQKEIQETGGLNEPWKHIAYGRIAADLADKVINNYTQAKFVEATQAQREYLQARKLASANLRIVKDDVVSARKRFQAHVFGPSRDVARKLRKLQKQLGKENLNPQKVAALKADIQKLELRQARAVTRAIERLERAGGSLEQMYSYLENKEWVNFYRMSRKVIEAKEFASVDPTDRSAGALFGRLFIEFRMAMMLSGLGTHIANVTGNTANQFLRVSRLFAEASINTVAKNPDAATMGEFKAYMTAYFKAMGRAGRNFMMAYATEMPILEADLNASTDAEIQQHTLLMPGLIGRILRFPSLNTLLAFDELFKTMAAHGEASAILHREGRNDGLTGEALEAHIEAGLIDYSNPVWSEALDNAKLGVFQGPPGAIVRALMNLRQFTDDLFPVLPLGSMLLPYIKTPGGIFKAGLETPAHPLVLVYRLLAPSRIKENYVKSGEMITDSANAVVAMSLIMGVISYMDDDDDIPVITGSSEVDYLDYLRQKAVAPPYSVRIGDSYYSYSRVEPFAISLATIVDAYRAFQKAVGNAPDGGTQAMQTLWDSFTAQLQDKTFLQTFGDLMKMLEDKDRLNVALWARNFFLTPMTPALVRGTMSAADPYERMNTVYEQEGKSAWTAAVESMEYVAFPTKDNYPPIKYDLWGRPIEKMGRSYTARLTRFFPTSQEVTDINRLDLLIMRFNQRRDNGDFGDQETKLSPRPLPRKAERDGVSYTLTPEEYATASRNAGAMAADNLLYANLNYDNPTQADRKIIEDALKKARKAAVDEVIMLRNF